MKQWYCGFNSDGRVSLLQSGSQRFESVNPHQQDKVSYSKRPYIFFIWTFLFYYSLIFYKYRQRNILADWSGHDKTHKGLEKIEFK